MQQGEGEVDRAIRLPVLWDEPLIPCSRAPDQFPIRRLWAAPLEGEEQKLTSLLKFVRGVGAFAKQKVSQTGRNHW